MDSDIFPVIFGEKVQFFQVFQKKSGGGVCVPPPPRLWLRRFRRPKGFRRFKALRMARASKDLKDLRRLRLSAVTPSWPAERCPEPGIVKIYV